jgi:hypothetical protein
MREHLPFEAETDSSAGIGHKSMLARQILVFRSIGQEVGQSYLNGFYYKLTQNGWLNPIGNHEDSIGIARRIWTP